ncbi:hypothetical protein MMC29_006942 [Sticta canariensis]|nr:hypothetical protein [Sticta canariensis]
MVKVLNALAAAYRGKDASSWLPQPCLHTGLWPADLARLQPGGLAEAGPPLHSSASHVQECHVALPDHLAKTFITVRCQQHDMLADGRFSIGAHADHEKLHGAAFNQLLKGSTQMVNLVTVHAAQVCGTSNQMMYGFMAEGKVLLQKLISMSNAHLAGNSVKPGNRRLSLWLLSCFIWHGVVVQKHMRSFAHVQEDLTELKQLIGGHRAVADLPYISTNDVVLGLTWLLECENQALPLPGQGAAGAVRKCGFSAALALNGLPAEALHPGFIGNCLAALFVTVTADGSMQERAYNDAAGLEHCLALAVAAYRRAIVAIRQPGAAAKAAVDTAALVPTAGYQMLLDMLGTQPLDTYTSVWSSFDNQMDFGNGQRCLLNGHMDWLPFKGSWVTGRSNGIGIRLLCNNKGFARLRDSQVLKRLAPMSGMLPGLAAAFMSHLTAQ